MAEIKIGGSYSGYSVTNYLLNEIGNRTFAVILLILGSPIFLALAIMVKLQDGGSIFYSGLRLGKDKKLYYMYKFRSLVPNAEQIIGAELLSPKHKLITKSGKFLRDTRLDELPQIINIIKGDMEFIGPRPERPAIYEKMCKHIKGYDKRFDVKPGLIGYSQLFTPHGAPKKMRTLIDNKYVKIKKNFLFDMMLALYTAMVVGRQTIIKSFIYIKNLLLIRGKDKRVLKRFSPKNASVKILDKESEDVLYECQLIDINEQALLMACDDHVDELDGSAKTVIVKVNQELGSLEHERLIFHLEAKVKKSKKRIVTKIAVCHGQVYKKFIKNDITSYVIKYEPISPFNAYMVHNYFLHYSIVTVG